MSNNKQFQWGTSPCKISTNSHGIIQSYAAQTTSGLVRPHNEDRIALILNIKTTSSSSPTQSFIGIYDGHAGSYCADYLRDHLHAYLGREGMFTTPSEDKITQAFAKAEDELLASAVQENGESLSVINRSGSCALCLIMQAGKCFVANVGDSRAIMSKNHGAQVIDITRDHKPGDKEEETRILANQGKIYYNESVYGPLRVLPGRLSVCRTFGDVEAKNEKLGGNPNVVIAKPDIFVFDIDESADFIVLASDGVYDKLSSEEVVQAAWDGLHANKFNNEHDASGLLADNIVKEAMKKKSLDNLSVVVLCFEKFKNIINDQLKSLERTQIKENILDKQSKLKQQNLIINLNNCKSHNINKVYSLSNKNQNENSRLYSQQLQRKSVQPLKEIKNSQEQKQTLSQQQESQTKSKIQMKKLNIDLLNPENKENFNNKNMISNLNKTKPKELKQIDALYSISPKIKSQTTQASAQQFNFNFNEITQEKEAMGLKNNLSKRKIAFANDGLNNYYQQTKQLINNKLRKSFNDNKTLLNFQKQLNSKKNCQNSANVVKKVQNYQEDEKLLIEGKNAFIKESVNYKNKFRSIDY